MFIPHNRGTQGQRILRLRKNDEIIGVLGVSETEDVVCVTLLGQTLRIHVDTISIQGRNAGGVRVVRMKWDDDSIVAIASTDRDDEAEVETPDEEGDQADSDIDVEDDDEA